MQRAMIILNPSSGKEEAKNYKDVICDVVQSKGYDYVIAVGGVGTINETVFRYSRIEAPATV